MEKAIKKVVLDTAYMQGLIPFSEEDITAKLITDGNLIFDTEAMLLAATPTLIKLNIITLRKVHTMSTIHAVYFNVVTHYPIGYKEIQYQDKVRYVQFNDRGMFSRTFDIGSPLIEQMEGFNEMVEATAKN